MAVIDVSWASGKLARSCSSDSLGKREFGEAQWQVIKRRLAVLRAAPTVADLVAVPGRFHVLTGDRAGCFALDLRGPYRLIFSADHQPIPTLSDGGIDLSQVNKVMIEEVVNYHGN
ncbi:type II toxin-antitoxin system RelE/ParE family toxin [Hamadaea sp. NPDC050747]|uniref:type II toxin-antitoxin system RelE/ParE family toxin n=1 Tax=Hamadaea sp. NPDC050747 TaxID=3155789 RepID=UPI0033C96521